MKKESRAEAKRERENLLERVTEEGRSESEGAEETGHKAAVGRVGSAVIGVKMEAEGG